MWWQCWLKRCTTWELWVEFYLGENEDCSQGGSTSDNSETLLEEVVSEKVKSLSRVRLCDPVDCSLSGSSVHGIFQARVLEWVAVSFSRGSSHPGIEPGSSTLQADALPSEPRGITIQPSHIKFNYLQTFTISSIAAAKIYDHGSLCSCRKTSVWSY